MEAAIVDGATGAYGAVAATQNIKNPIEAARAVMNDGRQSFLAGPAADEFARKLGITMVPNDYFTTATMTARLELQTRKAEDLETVGAVALDTQGNLAAASSTGGLTGKAKGTIGDTAIIGASLFADQNVAVVWLVSRACNCNICRLRLLTCIDSSGKAQDILRHVVASKVAVLNRVGSLKETLAKVIIHKAQKAPSACAIAAINSMGHTAFESSGRVFPVAHYTTNHSASLISLTTIPLLFQHMFHQDTLVTAGFTRYPLTPGHVLISCHGSEKLMSLPSDAFLKVMNTARQLSATLTSGSSTHFSGLACDGSGIISLLPLHGVDKNWKAAVRNDEEYNASFPGYITTMYGPKMADASLEETRSRIAAVTGITEPFDKPFDDAASNQHIFACVIREEVPQWRIWEDRSHVAFLTPYGNTPGYTVLVPRKHLGSDIFGLEAKDFTEIVEAAHKVAQYLKEAFVVERCGMFFGGHKNGYAHIKLIPVHDRLTPQGPVFNPIAKTAPFQEKYEGYLTTQFGPRASDLGLMANEATTLRELHSHRTQIVASQTLQQPSIDSLQALNSRTFAVQDTIFQSTMVFFRNHLRYKRVTGSAASDPNSSSMVLSSSSPPTREEISYQYTYFANSLQMALEYVVRVEEGLAGAFYVDSSFRDGYAADQTPPNRFYPVECELLGTLDDGIDMAERYLVAVAQAVLNKHKDTIRTNAGTTSHIENFINLAEQNDGHIPRITFSDALSLEEIVDTPQAWEYIDTTDPSKGRALKRAGEKILLEKFGGAVWVTEMDHTSGPFYRAFAPDTNNTKALSADLLLGASMVFMICQRHTSVQEVREALNLHNISEGDWYQWYLNIRDENRNGKILKTTGWGMALERFLAWTMKYDDTDNKDVIPSMYNTDFAY